MAYDEPLADRIRRALGSRPGVTEKKLFGGLAFLLDGRMFCGVIKDELMVRVGPARYVQALGEAHARPMDFTGRPMRGYVFAGRAGCRTVPAVTAWIERGVACVAALPVGDRTDDETRRTAPRKRRTR